MKRRLAALAAVGGLRSRLGQRPALVTLAGCLIVTVGLTAAIRSLERQRIRDEFEHEAASRFTAVHDGLDEVMDELRSLNRLVAAVPQLERRQFEAFARPVLAHMPQVELLGYQRMVTAQQRPAFEAARRQQLDGFMVSELAGGKLAPARPRALYRVTDYAVTRAGGQQLLGFDGATRAEQERAARRACANGTAVITDSYSLMLGDRMRQGFMVLMPVYRSGAAPGEARCDRVDGYTVAAIGSAALIERTLDHAPDPGADVEVYQDDSPNPAALVYRSARRTRRAPPLARLWGTQPLRAEASFEEGGRRWHVVVKGEPEPLLTHSLGSFLMFLLGSGASVLAAAYVGALSARMGGVARVVKERTAALTRANTALRRYEGELRHQATHDALTGLANRTLLAERLRKEIGAAARHEYGLWVLFVDLDRFKLVNDSLGHRAGDEFLRAIAQRLTASVRPQDTVARLGGDEFVLVLAERGDEQLSVSAVVRIMEAIARPVTVQGNECFINASIGIASYPRDSVDPEVLIACADLAMYRAKQMGRNTYQFYLPEMNNEAQERLSIERALRAAIQGGEFDLHYQAQLDLQSGRVVGVEALLRWRHPELGLLGPDRFLPVAEDTGLAVPIGAWAMRAACAQVRAWQLAGYGELRLALNVGLRQFNEPDLIGQVTGVLAETGLPPASFEIELTERIVMEDIDRAVEVLGGLRALGVSIAVDDFGTGYSSLAQLKRFPLDALKIDQSFVRTMSRQGNGAAIPDAIIALAHNLGMRVVAEGVDDESQCAQLAASMCDEIQGAVYGEPLDAQAFGALLAEGRTLPAHLLRMQKRQRTLLLVDDEPNILAALKRQLRGAGLRILTAPGGKEGLQLLETEQVDVIVSDQRMPGMTGVEFLRVVKHSHPETVRMVLSGFTELQSVTDAVNEGAIYKFLTKPWDDTQLRGHILEAFRHKEMADENRRLDMEVRTANQGLAQANRQLEEVLRQQQEQISRTGISLAIVHEALQHVPLPILGLDEDKAVAFANIAAQALFRDAGQLLGSSVEWFMPQLAAIEEGRPRIETVDGARYQVAAYGMGRGTRARGTLLIFSPAGPDNQQDNLQGISP